MPCLDEAETLATCIQKAQQTIEKLGLAAEIIVADNGSTDRSQVIARELGARVVSIARKGYGSALIGGIDAARGELVIMGDADDSYDFARLDGFVAKLREGYPLVMGNRFRGGIQKGAMPLLHRYLGNPVLSFVGRLLFRAKVGDFHCGLRGFDREAVRSLHLRTTGMEFASELVVKASLAGWRIAEVPTTLHPDGRGRPPHLRSWRDGWRHLRFLLVHSPTHLFILPGAILAGVGTLIKLDLRPEAFQFQSRAPFYWIVLALVGLALILVRRIEDSRFGAYLVAVRENEDAAKALGVDATMIKLAAMTISAAITAAAGGFYAQYFLFVDAGIAYGPWISVEALLAPIIGGIGTVFGPLLGALVVKTLGELTKLMTGDAPGLDLVIYGSVLILVIAFAPRGIAGILGDLYRRLRPPSTIAPASLERGHG